MKKIILYIICALIMLSSVFAVSRSTATGTVTYTKQDIPATILKGYWAIEDTVSGCTFNTATCGTSSYYGCSKSGSTIRVVGHSDDSGGNLPSSVVVTIGGTGTCVLSMNHVESWKTSTATNLGSSTGPVSGSVSLGTATCPIIGDTYPACDGIKMSELGILAQQWINAGGPTGTLLDNLAAAAQNWIDNGGPM